MRGTETRIVGRTVFMSSASLSIERANVTQQPAAIGA